MCVSIELKVQVTEPEREDYIRGADSQEFGGSDVEVFSPRKEESYGEAYSPPDYESGSSHGEYGGMLGSSSHTPRHQSGSVSTFGSRGSDGEHRPHDIFSLFGSSAGSSLRLPRVAAVLCTATWLSQLYMTAVTQPPLTAMSR
ncbi:hypothetical protein FHG87_009672 [Trinorchestia longiramus]|nr:hypothetical protein FHG87_009672 [Trinorchestia longiramus]